MTIFEFVLTLTSIIASLGLTHIVVGMVHLIRNASRVRFSFVHVLWVWVGFAFTVGNWASNWELRPLTSWPAWTVLMMIATSTAQYAYCAFVTPDAPDGEIDLVAFHESKRRGYLSALVVFGLLALLFNFTFGGANFYSDWLRDSLVTLVALGATLLALLLGQRWVQVAAALTVAGLATYFMLVATSIEGA